MRTRKKYFLRVAVIFLTCARKTGGVKCGCFWAKNLFTSRFLRTFVLAIRKMRVRVKAAAQHSSSELGSAFTLHFTCIVKINY